MWDHAIELTPNTNANLDCKVYPLNRNEQSRARQIPGREPFKRTKLTIKVTYGFTILLRQKEGRQATTRTRLSQAQRDDD